MAYDLGNAVGHIKMDSSGLTEGFSAALGVIEQFIQSVHTLSASLTQAEGTLNSTAQTMAGSLQSTAAGVTQAMQQTQAAVGQTANAVQTGLAGAAENASAAMQQAQTAAQQTANVVGGTLPDAMEQASESTEGLNDSLGETSDNMRDTGNRSEEAGKKAKKGMNEGEEAAKKFGDTAKKVADAVKKAFIALTAAITAAFAGALKVGADFEASMSQVAATMGTTVEAIPELSDIAKEMGASTKYTASQAAEALNYLALAGYTAEEQIAALPTVLSLASAGGMDLAYASDLVTDSMSALNLKIEDLTEFSDQLARTAQRSNTGVAQLGEAILQIGGTAKILAGGTTELNTALGILADNGIKGAEGGTALRQVLLNLTAPTDTAREYMQELGLSAFDAAGNMKPLNQTFGELAKILENATAEQRQEALAKIFDARQLKSAEALLSNYGDRWDELTKEITNSTGAAEAMAETMNDNLKGAVTIMQSAIEGLGITVYGSLEVPMRNAVSSATSEIDKLNASIKSGGLSASVAKLSEAFAELVGSAIRFAAEDAIPAIINMFEWIIDNGATILGIVEAIGAAFLAWQFGKAFSSLAAMISSAMTSLIKFAASTVTATAAQEAFNAAVAKNKYMIIGTALAALIAAIATAGKDMGVLNDAFVALRAIVVVAAASFGIYALKVLEAGAATGALTTKTVLATLASSKLVTALKAAWTVMAAHPMIAITAAIAAVAAAVAVLTTHFIKAKKEIPAAVQAVTDKYKEQQEALDRLAQKYEEAKEKSEEIKESEEDKIDLYAGLYEKLKENVDMTTGLVTNQEAANLTIKKMNDLYPNSIKLLEDQGRAYLDLSMSVEQYIEQLKSEALMKQLTPVYEQSIINLQKLKDTTDEAKQEWIWAGTAYEEAFNRYNKYLENGIATEEELNASRKAGFANVADYLKEQRDIAAEEVNQTGQIYQKQISLVSDAQKEIENYEQQIVDAKRDAMYNSDQIYSSELENQQDFYKRQADQYRQQMLSGDDSSDILYQHSEEQMAAMNDKLAELEDAYKKHQLSGDAEYYQKRLDIITNANLKEYAEWWELYDKTTDAQDKLNKEKASADKDAADKHIKTLQDAFDKEEKALDTNCKLGIITETQYYDQLEALLNEYKAKGLDLWEEYGDDIKIARKKIADDLVKSDKEAAERSFSAWSDSINSIIDAHKTEYDSIIANQDKLASSLSSYGDLYKMISEEVKKADGTTETAQKMQLENMDKQLASVEKFGTSVEKLKKRGLSQGLISEIVAMDTEKGQEYMNLLTKLSDSELKKYSDSYDKKQEYAKQFAKDFYASEIRTLEADFTSKVKTALEALPPETKLIGEDSINGFIEGVQSKQADSSETMQATMQKVIDACRATLDTHSPSVVFNGIGVNVMEGFEEGILEKAADVYTTMETIGANFVSSLLKGMQSQWEALKAWFASAASSLTLPQIDTAALSGASLSGYAPAWGTAQPQYNGNKNGFAGSYNGLTKQDVIDAVKTAYPDGDVIINVGEQEFGRICRDVISKAGRQTGKPVIKN